MNRIFYVTYQCFCDTNPFWETNKVEHEFHVSYGLCVTNKDNVVLMLKHQPIKM